MIPSVGVTESRDQAPLAVGCRVKWRFLQPIVICTIDRPKVDANLVPFSGKLPKNGVLVRAYGGRAIDFKILIPLIGQVPNKRKQTDGCAEAYYAEQTRYAI
jgi:hypothetical protein